MESPFSSILKALSCYTPRNQAAVYITLEYVNLGLGNVFPYSCFPPYEDDYYRMLENIFYKESEEKLSRILSLMQMDMETLISPLQKAFTKTGKLRKNSKFSPELLVPYGMMMDVLTRILKKFHTMSEAEINRLLDDYTQEDGRIYFNEIEKLSDEIAMDMMGGMMQSMDNNGFHLESNKDKKPLF